MFPTKNPGSRLTFILKDLLLSYLLTALLLLLLSLLLYRFSLSEKTVTLCITGIYILSHPASDLPDCQSLTAGLFRAFLYCSPALLRQWHAGWHAKLMYFPCPSFLKQDSVPY